LFIVVGLLGLGCGFTLPMSQFLVMIFPSSDLSCSRSRVRRPRRLRFHRRPLSSQDFLSDFGFCMPGRPASADLPRGLVSHASSQGAQQVFPLPPDFSFASSFMLICCSVVRSADLREGAQFLALQGKLLGHAAPDPFFGSVLLVFPVHRSPLPALSSCFNLLTGLWFWLDSC
jgi:hypothetical protein